MANAIYFFRNLKVLYLAILLILCIAAYHPLLFDAFIYEIETESELLISGSSNINKFSCECSCDQDFEQHTMEILHGHGNNRFIFRDAFLNLTTTNLNCGHRIMNKDLYKTLKAKEYPQISIHLLSAEITDSERFNSNYKQTEIEATVQITLTGQEKIVCIPILAERLNHNKFHFSGEVYLKITEFGLTPPRAMLGLIKVEDEITIYLNLTVRVKSELR